MFSPIALQEFDEANHRHFVRTLTDEELVKAGKRLRILCGDVVTTTPCAFDQQLKICRDEYRRRERVKRKRRDAWPGKIICVH
jgi:hypothetical protein